MITPGKHTAVARDWAFGLTGQNNQQICVQFEITEGPEAGQCINWYGFFSDKTRQRTLESLRACGWKNDDLADMEGMGDLLVQLVVEMKLQTEGKSAGKEFPEVRWVNRLGGGGPIKLEKPMDDQQKRMFAAQMKMHARTVPVQKGGYAAPSEPTVRPPPDDDPF